MHPIWKDYYVDLGEVDFSEFFIDYDDEFAHNGIAYRRPDDFNCRVKINDICKNYLPTINLRSGVEFIEARLPLFNIYNKDASVDEYVRFFNDWSYEEYGQNINLACPINGRVTSRMPLPLFCPIVTAQDVEVEVIHPDGDVSMIYPASIRTDSGLYLLDLDICTPGDLLGAAIYTGEGWSVASEYQVVDSCARYALYYENARGGWDALLIEGNHSESDSLTRHERSVEYDNSSVSNRGRVNYGVEIKKRMTFHTSWMSDEESSRMHHLLNSTNVYLYDIEKEQFIPVLLTNSTTEYKTYKSNGGKLVNYTIEVEFANERIRK